MQNWERRYIKTIGNESLCENINDSGVRVVHFTTSENLVLKSIMFLYQNICKYTWISPDRKTRIQIDHILIGDGIQLSFRGADSDLITVWWLQTYGRNYQ